MDTPLPITLTDRFPQELFDHIIAYLCTPTCALVCKAWLPSARFQLLSSPTNPSLGFEPIIISQDNAGTLLELLASPHCTLRAHLRSVCIRPGGRMRLQQLASPYLVDIERIMVCPEPGSSLWDNVIGWMAGYAHSLTEIVLVEVMHLSFVQFLQLLLEVKGLRHVGLVRVGWADTEWESAFVKGIAGSGEPDPLPHLRSLVLEDYSIDVLNWLYSLMQHGVPQITSLDLRGNSGRTPSPLNIYIDELVQSHYNTLGGTLRELDLYYLHHTTLSLRLTPHLRHIWFHGVRVGESSTGQWVLDVLKTVVPESRIRVITFDIFADPSISAPFLDGDDEDWVDCFDWNTFAEILSDKGKFPQLERVELSLEYYTTPRACHILFSMQDVTPGLTMRVAEMDQTPRFGFLSCGRVE